MTRSQLDTENQTTLGTFDQRHAFDYAYQPNGLVTSIKETVDTTLHSVQCFGYDQLARLTQAYTDTTTTCPTTGFTPAGQDPYWTSWTYDAVGDRTQQNRHSLTGGTDTVTTYTYPSSGSAQPHKLNSTSTTGPGGTTNASYGYDTTGNTTGRTLPGSSETLTWDPEGHLASQTINSQTTSYVYHAGGARLTRTDPDGTVTAYLGGEEIKQSPGGTLTATRYYGSLASRTPTGLTWLDGDQHDTATTAVDATSLTATTRRTMPFGEPRGADPTWPNTKGFVGGTKDPTGLTHLGAREYDPTTGRFISVDPLFDLTDPQSWNGYAYADNRPTSSADASGLGVKAWFNAEGGSPGGRGTTWRGWSNEASAPIASQEENALSWAIGYGGGKGGSGGGKLRSSKFGVDDATPGSHAKSQKVPTTHHNDLLGNPRQQQRKNQDALNERGRGAGGSPKTTKTKPPAKDPISGTPTGTNPTGGLPSGKSSGSKPPSTPPKKPTSSSCHSFDPNTPVMMADGTTKPIKDIKIGDKVLASDPRSRTLEAQNVTALHVNLDVGLIDLVVAAADGTVATIHTTSHHLFWDDTVEAWVPAAGLEAGPRLRAPTSGAHVVVAIKKVAGTRVMLDLTVDNLHTYYVVAGGTPILVHNDGEVPGNTRRIFNIAGEYNGRIDRFPYRGQAHFEIHVFYGQTEVGIFGSNGWIGKHGHPADMRLWSAVENRLKGVAIAEMKRSGRLPLDANVKDDAWKRPHVDGGC